MILTPHILVGAVIGAKTQNLGLIIILGILIHFILDKIPHWDYDLPSVFRNFRKDKKFKPLISDFIKMAIDITVGFLIVFFILWHRNALDFNYLPFILIGILVSLFHDVFFGSIFLFPGKTARKINKIGYFFHYKPKQKEGRITFLGLSTQIIVIIISCVVLLNL